MVALRMKSLAQHRKYVLHGLPEALSTHLSSFSSFIVSSTRDATATFCGYLRGLFQSERANMLRMGGSQAGQTGAGDDDTRLVSLRHNSFSLVLVWRE